MMGNIVDVTADVSRRIYTTEEHKVNYTTKSEIVNQCWVGKESLAFGMIQIVDVIKNVIIHLTAN